MDNPIICIVKKWENETKRKRELIIRNVERNNKRLRIRYNN